MTAERLQLEREIVYAAMERPGDFATYSRVLSAELFADRNSQQAIEAMHELLNSGVEINLINVRNATRGEVAYPDSTSIGVANMDVASRKLTELFILDRKNTLIDAIKTESNPFAVIEEVNEATDEFASLIAAHSTTPKTVVLAKFLEQLEKNVEGGFVRRIPTGFATLDRWCKGGLRLGNMSFIGGTPGVGKTSFMLKLGSNASAAGYETRFIEGEMEMSEVLARMTGQHTKLPVNEIEDGKHLVETHDFLQIVEKSQFEVRSDFGRNVRSLTSSIQAAVHEGAQLIVVDYLQVFVEKGGRAADEFGKIKQLSEMLRKLCLVNHVHIMAASSLNRLEVGAQKLTLNSFYGGSQLGHDCYLGLILTEADGNVEGADVRTVTCEVVKNRGGNVGNFAINYNLPSQDMNEQDNIHIHVAPRVGQMELPLADQLEEKDPW